MIAKPAPPLALSFSPLSIVKAIWNQKLLVAFCWVAISAGVVAYVHRMPPVYSADAVVQVESQRIPEKYVSATVNADLQDRVTLLRQQLLSYTRLWSIIERFNLYRNQRRKQTKEEVVDEMRKDITITFERGLGAGPSHPGSFRVTYRGNDPSTVARVTNMISNFFIEENLRAREVEAVGTSEFLENQLAEARKHLEEQERQVSAFKTEHNGELPEQENALLSSLGQFKVQLMGIQDRITREQQNKLMLQTALENAETSELTMDRLDNGRATAPVYATVPGATNATAGTSPLRESEQLKGQLTGLRARGYTDAYPGVRRLVDAIRRAEENEAAKAPVAAAPVTQAAAPDTRAAVEPRPQQNAAMITIRERIQSLKMQIAVSTNEVQNMEREQQRLIREITELEVRIRRLPLSEQQLASITRDYEITKANYRSLLDRRMSADVAAEMEHRQKAERFVMLELARTPEKPIKPQRSLLNAGGSIFGLMAGLALALMLELRKGVLMGEWELPPGVIVLGRIPKISVARESEPPAAVSKGRKSLWRRPLAVTAVVAALGILTILAYAFRGHWTTAF